MIFKPHYIKKSTLIAHSNHTQVPAILLKGKLVEEAGFKCGEYVEVEVEGNTISMTKATPPEAPSRKLLEEKIKDLYDKQRKKLAKMLESLLKEECKY